jgi:hypothetical protein
VCVCVCVCCSLMLVRQSVSVSHRTCAFAVLVGVFWYCWRFVLFLLLLLLLLLLSASSNMGDRSKFVNLVLIHSSVFAHTTGSQLCRRERGLHHTESGCEEETPEAYSGAAQQGEERRDHLGSSLFLLWRCQCICKRWHCCHSICRGRFHQGRICCLFR